MGHMKGYRFPKLPCPMCGVEATGYKNGPCAESGGVRGHRCPHGISCWGRRSEVPTVDGEYQLPYRDCHGQWARCPWCLATHIARLGFRIEGQPEWLTVVRAASHG